MSARALRRRLAAGAAGVAVLLALPAAAGAHVEAEGETAAGVTTVTFGFHHGCTDDATKAEQPTTSLRVQLPEGATEVTPEDPTGWTSTVTGTELAWTGGSIPYDGEGSFVVSMELTDPEGTTVFLPTVQGCAGGTESAWIDKSEDPEAEHAAPRIIVGAPATTGDHEDEEEAQGSHGTAPTGAAPTTTAPGTSTTAAAATTAAPVTENASSSSTPLIIGIIAAVVVIAIVAGVVLSRRGSTDPSDPTSGSSSGGAPGGS